MIKELEINPEKELKRLVGYLRWSNKYLGTEGCVLGISGGVDSCLCAFLASQALGKRNVLGIMMPEKNSNPADLEDAIRFANWLGIDFILHPITSLLKLYDTYKLSDTFDFDKEIKPYFMGDVSVPFSSKKNHSPIMKLRGRMYTLTNYAFRLNFLHCDTVNKTERLLAWYDVFGDMAGDVAFIEHLWKTQIYSIARYFKFPEYILNRPAGSGLFWPLADEEELGMSFKEADSILYYLDKGVKDTDDLLSLTGLEIKKIKKIKAHFDFSKKMLNKPIHLDSYEKLKEKESDVI